MKKTDKIFILLILFISLLVLHTLSVQAIDQNPSYIILPEALTTLGSEAFAGCTNATDIYFPATVSYIGDFPLDISQVRVHCLSNSDAWNYFYDNYPEYRNRIIAWNGAKPTGDTLTISGTVYDVNYMPVSGVQVTVTNTSDMNDVHYTTTDANGHWSLKLFNETTYRIAYAHSSYNVTSSQSAFRTYDGLSLYATAQSTNHFTYEALDDGTCRISKYVGPKVNTLEIPAQGPDGCVVTEIGPMNARSGTMENDRYTKVIIPSGVKVLKYLAFRFSTELTEVVFPDGLTTIESYAFGSEKLTKISLPDSITTLGARFFYDCPNLTEVNYPRNLTDTIQDIGTPCSPFETEQMLHSITVPEGVTEIPENIFRGFKGETVYLPDTLESVSENAFYASDITHITIPSHVTSIADSAFQFCDELLSITLPKSLETIGNEAFDYCIKLKNFRIPENVKSIGDSALYRWEAINVLYFPESLESLGSYAFSSNNALTDVYLPGNINTLKTFSIHNYPNLDNGITKIHTIEDSYVWNWIRSNNPRLEVGVQLLPWDGSYPTVTVSGTVTGENGEPLKDVAVKAVNKEFTDDYTIIWTNYRGQWTMDLDKDDTYDISYWLDGYTFTTDVTSFTASEGLVFNATGTLDQVLNNEITFTMKQNGELVNTITVGTSVDFEVTVPERTEMIRLVVDNVAYEWRFLEFGSTTISFSRLISSAGNGTRTVQFQIGRNYEWGDLSYPQTLTVNKSGKMSVPVIHAIEPHERTRDLTVSWDAVDHAQSYTVYVYYDGAQVWPENGIEPEYVTETSYTLSGNVFQIAGTYSVQVNTVGKGYESSTGYMDAVIADGFDYGALAASAVVTVYSPINTVMPDAMIQVSAPEDGFIYQSVSTGDDGIAVINGLKQGRTYRFDCYHGYFAYDSIELIPSSQETSFSFYAQPTDKDYLIIVPGGKQVDQAGGTAVFQVTSSAAWSANTSNDWLTLSASSGNPSGMLTVTADSNESYFRNGEIQITMADRTVSAYVNQPGALSSRLEVPMITYPAADNDQVPFDDLTVTWEAVDGAAGYVISLRDRDSGMLLFDHLAAGEETEATFSSAYFSENTNYRVAVGAVPAGAKSTDPVVGWCERLFSTAEYQSGDDVSLAVSVFTKSISYEAHDASASEIGAAKAGGTASIEINKCQGVKIELYYYDEAEHVYKFDRDYTPESNEYTFTGLVDNRLYAVLCVKDGIAFQLKTMTVHAGKTELLYVYGKPTGSQDDIEALERVKMQNALTNKVGGLFAEYFIYEKDGVFDKEKSFTAKNKRNEGTVQAIDLSWSHTEEANKVYQLHQHTFADKGQGEDVQKINYLPYKFSAIFNGYIKLKGAPTEPLYQEIGRSVYHFRLKGKGNVRLKMSLSIDQDDWTWNSGWKNDSAVITLEKGFLAPYYFANGTVLRIEADYKHSSSGDANLILEYSIDNKNSWHEVTPDWFYQGERLISIIGDDGEILGDIDYAGMLVKANDALEGYSDKLISDMLIDLADSAVSGYVDSIDPLDPHTKIYKSVINGDKRTVSDFLRRHIGKRVAKAFYTAVFNQSCNLNDEKGIWKAITDELKSQFNFDFVADLGLDITNTNNIDSIGYVQAILKKMFESGFQSMNQYRTELKERYNTAATNTFENHAVQDDDEIQSFFDVIVESVQDQIVGLIDKVVPGTKKVYNFARESFESLEEKFDADRGNKNRAKFSLLYAEAGKQPDQWNTVIDRITLEMAGKGKDQMYWAWHDTSQHDTLYKAPDRSNFETKLNSTTNEDFNAFACKYQGVDLDEILYKELLKNVLDVTFSHYKDRLRDLIN